MLNDAYENYERDNKTHEPCPGTSKPGGSVRKLESCLPMCDRYCVLHPPLMQGLMYLSVWYRCRELAQCYEMSIPAIQVGKENIFDGQMPQQIQGRQGERDLFTHPIFVHKTTSFICRNTPSFNLDHFASSRIPFCEQAYFESHHLQPDQLQKLCLLARQ